ncbi:hypothetical protein NDU88_002261 [Pleurodeles waltl]|uniref:Uncharacterized protein n=1 Tax=Pleurodeles waltl TaxID=8319 RepID=A0AAV7WQ55_PLEWA|nr:hypothetical protein NDU88_002261 [Pleurodeles waltl]
MRDEERKIGHGKPWGQGNELRLQQRPKPIFLLGSLRAPARQELVYPVQHGGQCRGENKWTGIGGNAIHFLFKIECGGRVLAPYEDGRLPWSSVTVAEVERAGSYSLAYFENTAVRKN